MNGGRSGWLVTDSRAFMLGVRGRRQASATGKLAAVRLFLLPPHLAFADSRAKQRCRLQWRSDLPMRNGRLSRSGAVFTTLELLKSITALMNLTPLVRLPVQFQSVQGRTLGPVESNDSPLGVSCPACLPELCSTVRCRAR